MEERKPRGKRISRRELLKDSTIAAAVLGAGAGSLGAQQMSSTIKPIVASAETDQLEVAVPLGKDDLSITIDGQPVNFTGGAVRATYKSIPNLKPVIRVLDVTGKVRQTIPTNLLIEAHSPFLFACCCCCCCQTSTIGLPHEAPR